MSSSQAFPQSPGPRISAKISRAVDEPRRCASVGIGFGSQSHTIRHPRLWIIRDIAEEFYLHLVGRVEPARRAVVLPHGAKCICANSVKVELPIVLQAIGEQVRSVPVLGIFLIHVAGIAPPS